MNNSLKTPVENFLNWEKKKGKNTFLVQPIDGRYLEFSWERVGSEARRMCNYINSLHLPKKSKIAILSKNCAHWIIADLAIMMSGNISVPIYANVNGDTAKYILNHSESELLFVGKLEKNDWDDIKSIIPKKIKKFDSEVLEVSTSKRSEPRVPFGQIIERGMLSPGEQLWSLNGRHKAKVRADGTLIGDDIKGSIHQVGAALEGAPSCNGWTYWGFKRDGKMVPIDILRQQIRSEVI